MIATRMVIFESTEQQPDNSPEPIHKAVSMGNLMGGAGGSLAIATEGKQGPSSSVMCNPSTGQAVLLPRVPSSSSLLNCIRATTQGPSPKLRPQHTPSPLTSDSDYSSGSSHLTPPRDGDPSEFPLDPPQMSPTTGMDSPQMSPTTGMARQRGAVGALRQLFEITSPQHKSLFRATSLPTLHHSPQAPQHRRPHPPPLVNTPPPPNTSSKASPTRKGSKGKVPLLPPVKRVQFLESQTTSSRQQQSSSDHYSNQHSSNVGTHKKIPLLPQSASRPPTSPPTPPSVSRPPTSSPTLPSASRPPTSPPTPPSVSRPPTSPPTPPSASRPPTTSSPPTSPSNIPPPKPPRAAHRLRLAQECVQVITGGHIATYKHCMNVCM